MPKYVVHIKMRYRDGTIVSDPKIITAESENEASKIGKSIARGREVTTGVETTCAEVRKLHE